VRRRGPGAAAALAVAALAIAAASAAVAAELLKPGDAFPAWRLRDQSGKEVASSSLAGTTYVLWFYPKAMTPGCTAEAGQFRDAYAKFQAAGVEVLGVSLDSPADNAEFAKRESLPFRLLSDDGTLAVAVGAASASDQRARRISYLVDGSGRVLRAYPDVRPAEHATQVLQDVAAVPSPAR
jgi:peroxiredoxin Q/BCP